MSETKRRRGVSATVRVRMTIPAEVCERWLDGTVFEGSLLGFESDRDRDFIGEIFDERVSERFADLLDFIDDEPEAETDW